MEHKVEYTKLSEDLRVSLFRSDVKISTAPLSTAEPSINRFLAAQPAQPTPVVLGIALFSSVPFQRIFGHGELIGARLAQKLRESRNCIARAGFTNVLQCNWPMSTRGSKRHLPSRVGGCMRV